jgi:hypothetical protein
MIDAQFQRSHVDRMPTGDLVGTILELVIANPDIHWSFEYSFNRKTFTFDDEPIKNELGDISMSEPDILRCIHKMILDGILEVNPDYSTDDITISFNNDRRS